MNAAGAVPDRRPAPAALPGRLLQLVVDVAALEWMDRALCQETDPEAFYPVRGGSNRAAKAICAACEVRSECLEYALAQPQIDDWGIWAGTTEQERGRMRRAAARSQNKEAA